MNDAASGSPADRAAEADPPLANERSESRWRQASVPFAAALLALAASFANFLSYHGYPIVKPEVAIVAAGLATAAAIFALLHVHCSNFGKAILDGFLVFLAIDLNSDQTVVAAGAAAVVAFLRLGRGISLLQPLSIVAAVVLSSAALGMTETRSAIARTEGNVPAATGGKAILHIILDEHGGVGGSSDAAFRGQLTAFYERHGFRLFERAYSRHFHTVNAIPDVLNFGHPGDSRNIDETLDIGRTAYLSGLERRGYRLNLYQSDFADFCRYSRYAACTSYWSPSLGFVEPLPLPAAQKARLIAFKFTALSGLLQAMAGAIDDLTRLPLARPLVSRAQITFRIIRRKDCPVRIFDLPLPRPFRPVRRHDQPFAGQRVQSSMRMLIYVKLHCLMPAAVGAERRSLSHIW